MCGILGFSSKTNNYDLEKIKTLMLCNSYERGGDGLGIFTPKTGVIKDNVSAQKFILSEDFKNKLLDDKILIGHARKSSSGGKTVNNTHPFEYDNIVAVHNGTLQKHSELAREYNLKHTDWYIDTHVICKALSLDITKKGYDVYPEVFTKYQGFATIVYYSKETNSIYVHRDKDREIYYGFIDNSLYISSLEYSLKIIGCEDIKVFEPDKIYRIKDGIIDDVIEKPVIKEYLRLASIKDITKKYIISKLSYEIGIKNNIFTGITTHVLDSEPKCVIGYKLRYTNFSINYGSHYNTSEKEANVTKNKFYEILDIRRQYESSLKTTEIQFKFIDNNKEEKWVSHTKFDISNFIFVKNRYAKVTANLFNTRTEEKVANIGEFVKIINHDFGSLECKVLFECGKIMDCDIKYLEVLDEDAHKVAHLVFTKEKKESPFKNEEKDIKLLNPPLEEDMEVDDEEDEYEEDFISFAAVKKYLNNLSKDLDGLVSNKLTIPSHGINKIVSNINKIKETSDIIDLTYNG